MEDDVTGKSNKGCQFKMVVSRVIPLKVGGIHLKIPLIRDFNHLLQLAQALHYQLPTETNRVRKCANSAELQSQVVMHACGTRHFLHAELLPVVRELATFASDFPRGKTEREIYGSVSDECIEPQWTDVTCLTVAEPASSRRRYR